VQPVPEKGDAGQRQALAAEQVAAHQAQALQPQVDVQHQGAAAALGLAEVARGGEQGTLVAGLARAQAFGENVHRLQLGPGGGFDGLQFLFELALGAVGQHFEPGGVLGQHRALRAHPPDPLEQIGMPDGVELAHIAAAQAGQALGAAARQRAGEQGAGAVAIGDAGQGGVALEYAGQVGAGAQQYRGRREPDERYYAAAVSQIRGLRVNVVLQFQISLG